MELPNSKVLEHNPCLDQIRKRAFGKDASIPATAANIKAERHKEFLGEGMRFLRFGALGRCCVCFDGE